MNFEFGALRLFRISDLVLRAREIHNIVLHGDVSVLVFDIWILGLGICLSLGMRFYRCLIYQTKPDEPVLPVPSISRGVYRRISEELRSP